MKIRKGQNRIYRFFDPDHRFGLYDPHSVIGKELPSLGFMGNLPSRMMGGVGYYVVPDNMVKL